MIDKIHCDKKYGADISKSLIALLKHTQEDKPLLPNVTREFYNQVKNNSKDYPLWLVGNVEFLASFNGKGFKGGYAGYNRKDKRDYYQESKRNLEKQSQSLLFKDICFFAGNYVNTPYLPNTLIYCDPPYQGTTGYGNKFNHEDFWQWVRYGSFGNYVIISEENAPDDFACIWKKDTLRSLNAQGSRNYKTEKLFIYNKGLAYEYFRKLEDEKT